jgi:antitoxin (DNA-binding transcriptional repressor) of toxin-antitoxin stability system
MTSGGGEVAAAISARQLETPDAKLPKLLKRIRAGLSGLYVHAEIPIARLVIVVVE